MSTIITDATLQSDGITLRLDTKVDLPPGRVTVAMQSMVPTSGSTMLDVLDRIHREQRQRGRVPTTEEDMAAEIAEMRAEDDEYEERWRQLWSQTGEQGKNASKI
jgi:hypothetical protein